MWDTPTNGLCHKLIMASRLNAKPLSTWLSAMSYIAFGVNEFAMGYLLFYLISLITVAEMVKK
jgi:4-amino-4-deoxy-L-arabinose transferase-like glycosyltransferase